MRIPQDERDARRERRRRAVDAARRQLRRAGRRRAQAGAGEQTEDRPPWRETRCARYDGSRPMDGSEQCRARLMTAEVDESPAGVQVETSRDRQPPDPPARTVSARPHGLGTASAPPQRGRPLGHGRLRARGVARRRAGCAVGDAGGRPRRAAPIDRWSPAGASISPRGARAQRTGQAPRAERRPLAVRRHGRARPVAGPARRTHAGAQAPALPDRLRSTGQWRRLPAAVA